MGWGDEVGDFRRGAGVVTPRLRRSLTQQLALLSAQSRRDVAKRRCVGGFRESASVYAYAVAVGEPHTRSNESIEAEHGV